MKIKVTFKQIKTSFIHYEAELCYCRRQFYTKNDYQ